MTSGCNARAAPASGSRPVGASGTRGRGARRPRPRRGASPPGRSSLQRRPPVDGVALRRQTHPPHAPPRRARLARARQQGVVRPDPAARRAATVPSGHAISAASAPASPPRRGSARLDALEEDPFDKVHHRGHPLRLADRPEKASPSNSQVVCSRSSGRSSPLSTPSPGSPGWVRGSAPDMPGASACATPRQAEASCSASRMNRWLPRMRVRMLASTSRPGPARCRRRRGPRRPGPPPAGCGAAGWRGTALLVLEVVIQPGLGDAGRLGDLSHRQAVVAVREKRAAASSRMRP